MTSVVTPETLGELNQSSPITDAHLLKMNTIGMWLHFIQGTLMFVTYLVVDSVNNFSRPIFNSFLVFNEVTRNLEQDSSKVFDLPVGLLTPFFLWLSAIAHFLIVFVNTDKYLNEIRYESINRVRWYEYALSSSLMIVLIAVLFGVWDFGNLIAIIGLNITMNLLGLLMEEGNNLSVISDSQSDSESKSSINWNTFNLGCFTGFIPWLNIMCAFLGGGDFQNTPGFVYAIVFGYFFFFNTFPINMWLQYKRFGRWKDYRFGEVVYIWLSLLSKSLLAWLVFGGTFQPNGDNDDD